MCCRVLSCVAVCCHVLQQFTVSAAVCCRVRHLSTLCYGVVTISGLLKLKVSFAKEAYKRDYILQKRPILLRSLLIVAAPYPILWPVDRDRALFMDFIIAHCLWITSLLPYCVTVTEYCGEFFSSKKWCNPCGLHVDHRLNYIIVPVCFSMLPCCRSVLHPRSSAVRHQFEIDLRNPLKRTSFDMLRYLWRSFAFSINTYSKGGWSKLAAATLCNTLVHT